MAYSYAKTKSVNSSSAACGGPRLRRKYTGKCAEFIGGCDSQTEASDTGKGGTTSDGTHGGDGIKGPGRHQGHGACKYTAKHLESDSGSPACRGTGMQRKRKDIVKLVGTRFIGGCSSHIEASDSGVGSIEPCHGKVNTSDRRIGDESMSALEIVTDAEVKGDSGGQDEAYESGTGGIGSGGGPNPLPRPQPPGPKPRPRRQGMKKREQRCFHGTEFIGDPDIQTEASDSGVGGKDSGRDSSVGNLTASPGRKAPRRPRRSSAQSLPRLNKREKSTDCVREILEMCERIEQDQYDADGELSDEGDGDGESYC